MLFQQVAEGFIGELLEVHHAITGKQVECVPRPIIELDSLSRHLFAHFPLAMFRICSSRLQRGEATLDHFLSSQQFGDLRVRALG